MRNQLTNKRCLFEPYSLITQMSIDVKLPKVPCVQFSLFDNNTILSEFNKSMLITQGISWFQVLTVTYVVSNATSWAKGHRRYPRRVSTR